MNNFKIQNEPVVVVAALQTFTAAVLVLIASLGDWSGETTGLVNGVITAGWLVVSAIFVRGAVVPTIKLEQLKEP